MYNLLLLLILFLPVLPLPLIKCGRVYRATTLLLLIVSLLVDCYLFKILNGKNTVVNLRWMPQHDMDISFSYNHTSSLFSLLVLVIAIPVVYYSFFYLKENLTYFISLLASFTTSMLLLVTSNSYINLFIAWELVGFISYLLVGFYGSKSAIFASNKTIIINRIGDLFLLSAIVLVYKNFHTFHFIDSTSAVHISNHTLNTIGFFMILAAMVKSAQFPLHTWLLDAMEAPTPVSALLHAATMVTAGVYLLNISSIFYGDGLRLFILVISSITIIFGGALGIVNRNLKKILASSTMSQLGFMFFGISLGKIGFIISLFYLFMHAALKASLFLTAGNLMKDNQGELDIDKIKLKKSTRKLLACDYLVNALALMGMPPLAIFFAKEELINYAYKVNYLYPILPIAGTVMTSIYVSKIFARVFLRPKIMKDKAGSQNSLFDVKSVMLVLLTVISACSPLLKLHEFFFNYLINAYPNIKSPDVAHAPIIVTALALGLSALAFILFTIIFKNRSIKDTAFTRKFARSFDYDVGAGYIIDTVLLLAAKLSAVVERCFTYLEKIVAYACRSGGVLIRSMYRGKFEDTILISLAAITLGILSLFYI